MKILLILSEICYYSFIRGRAKKNNSSLSIVLFGTLINIVAEKEGFEPSRRFPDKRISSAPRYDHFDTSPCLHCVF